MTGDPKISLLRLMPEKIRLYGNASLIGVILKDAGLSRPESPDMEGPGRRNLLGEHLAEADSDWIFYTSYGTPEATGEKAALEGPIWGKLEAVKAGQRAARERRPLVPDFRPPPAPRSSSTICAPTS